MICITCYVCARLLVGVEAFTACQPSCLTSRPRSTSGSELRRGLYTRAIATLAGPRDRIRGLCPLAVRITTASKPRRRAVAWLWAMSLQAADQVLPGARRTCQQLRSVVPRTEEENVLQHTSLGNGLLRNTVPQWLVRTRPATCRVGGSQAEYPQFSKLMTNLYAISRHKGIFILYLVYHV